MLNTNFTPQNTPNKWRRQHLHPYSPGELGKWAVAQADLLARLGWKRLFTYHQQPHSINTTIQHARHPTAQYLHYLACSGVPLTPTTPPWTYQERDTAYQRGPHSSAAIQFAPFLLQDMYDYVQMGYWLVLPYPAVQKMPSLRLSPAGVVPQRDRWPRPIMDYSFSGVNQASAPYAPFAAMQFGKTLPHLLQRLVYCNPNYGPRPKLI